MSARALIVVAAFVLVLGWGSPAGADGPVSHTTLPGDPVFLDSDPGPGEQWGRAGGRDYSFSNFDLGLFTQLEWGPVAGDSVVIAFDGTVSPGTGEQLSYAAGESSLPTGLAVWLGSTQVQLFPSGSFVPVDTRFELRVSDGFGNPIPLSFDPARGVPELDVLSTSGAFEANLRMLAKLSNSGAFQPALDLFDALDTHPTQTELALTSFAHGFYFESGTQLSLEEHDDNMVQRTGQILGDLDFLKIETVGGLGGLRTDVHNARDEAATRFSGLEMSSDDILTRIFEIMAQIDGLTQNGGLATGADVDNAREDIARVRSGIDDLLQALILLWGIETDDQGNPDLSTLKTIRSLSTQESVDALHQKSDLLAGLVLDQTAPLSSQQSVDDVRNGIDALLQQDQACIAQVGVLLERVSELETALDAAAQQQLEIQVLPSPRASKKHQRVVVLTTEAGHPVDASITQVLAITDKQSFEAVPVPFDVQPVADGLFDVEIRLDRGLSSTKLLVVVAEHAHAGGSHHGSVLVSLKHE